MTRDTPGIDVRMILVRRVRAQGVSSRRDSSCEPGRLGGPAAHRGLDSRGRVFYPPPAGWLHVNVRTEIIKGALLLSPSPPRIAPAQLRLAE